MVLTKKIFGSTNQIRHTWAQKPDFGGTERYGAVGFSIESAGYIGTGVSRGYYIKDFWNIK